MRKLLQSVSFGRIMKLWLLLLLCTSSTVFAQQKTIEGIVFDKGTTDRIAKINVLNTNTGKAVYNNLKGEFSIAASIGDVLIFTRLEYYPDTVKVQNFGSMAVYLKRNAIQLKEVNIRDTLLSPQKWLAATKSDYTKIYGSLAYKDLLSTSPGSGAGLSIDALYNALSRSGRNAAHLQEIIDADFKQKEIDYRFNKTYVSNITGLTGMQLNDFMFKYRPGYYQVKTASEYEFIRSIRNNLKRYLRNPRAFAIAPLLQSK
ncbi:hypothetical protein GCM10023149_47070 [Mucilaginibacter gynuensis]|uniref:Carboxypeptidase-like protein n=1 Tax=Mucilaginibacter gynuensis TaxID=1302236 RepID=A0ABP8HCX5_9SPHI